MRAVSSSLFLLVVLYAASSASGNTFHIWNGRLAYYNGDHELNFNDTIELCTSLGGKLPSIHSTDDTQFIARLVGSNARVWLGGLKNGSSFEWMDLSPLDHTPWLPDEPACNSRCCAIGYTTVGAKGFVAKDCSISRRMICVVKGLNSNMEHQIIPQDFNATIEKHEQAIQTLTEINFELMNSSMNALKQQFDQISSLGADSKSNLNQLNSSIRSLSDRLTSFYNTYDQRVNSMSVNLINLQSRLEILNQTVTQKTKQAANTMSLVQTQENHSRDQVEELLKDTERLNGRITFCFFTLIVIAAGLLSRAGFKLYQWARPMNPYKRQDQLRGSLTEDQDRL